ncbi:MAG TPA: DUF1302 family protein, partial [Nevskiaceae bacterium]|nr:DUF1302 family protein [Nevskiaceae bacterium]
DNLVGTEERTQGNAFLLSSAGRTVRPGPEQDARKQGQYGITLNYLATWLNNSSFSLSFLHLHSRFPFVNFISAIKGCASDATNQAEALASCRGFNGPTHLGVEPIPVDTVKFFISYPEDINALGGSFSTNLGAVAWTGEIVFRPNQPLQVDPTDLGFAALQPVFPGPNINFGVVTLPSRRTATPDYVETIYRHETVGPQQVIRGYERMHTLSYNTSFLLLNGASENPFGSDQVTSLLELGAFQVMGMPGLDQLQFAAPGTQFHHSAGVDSTGAPTVEQTQTSAQWRLNPHYQDGGFATAFSWGYRILEQLSYEDVLPNLRLTPQLSWSHDVGGISPIPTGEFVAGRKQAMVGLAAQYLNDFGAALRYNWYFGGGLANGLSDRDNLQLSFSYDF